MTFNYLILKDKDSYTGEELKPDSVKGSLVSALKEGEEFIYRSHSAPRQTISTGKRIENIRFPHKGINADLELILDDGTSEFLINL